MTSAETVDDIDQRSVGDVFMPSAETWRMAMFQKWYNYFCALYHQSNGLAHWVLDVRGQGLGPISRRVSPMPTVVEEEEAN